MDIISSGTKSVSKVVVTPADVMTFIVEGLARRLAAPEASFEFTKDGKPFFWADDISVRISQQYCAASACGCDACCRRRNLERAVL